MGALQLKEIGRLLLVAAAKVENGSALAPREIGALKVLDECLGEYAGAERWQFLEISKPWGELLTELELRELRTESEPGSLRYAYERDFGTPVKEFPRRAGDYEVLALVGWRGLGSIYLAKHIPTGRKVELRFWSAFPEKSPEAFAMALRVAKVAESIEHPSLARVYEACFIEGRFCTVQEPAEGTTLLKLIRQLREAQLREAHEVKPPSSSEFALLLREIPAASPGSGWDMSKAALFSAVGLIERVARGLHVAHEAGVIHRNIKPANIVVKPDGAPVLTNLALGQFEGAEAQAPGGPPGTLYGTSLYMSPEQWQSDVYHLDRRTDVYSLAATLFECVTLRPPHDARSPEGLCRQALAGEHPDPRQLNPLVPPALKAVLDKALAADRERRYATALNFAEDLRRVRVSALFRAQFCWPLRFVRKCTLRLPVLERLLKRLDRKLFGGSGVLAV